MFGLWLPNQSPTRDVNFRLLLYDNSLMDMKIGQTSLSPDLKSLTPSVFIWQEISYPSSARKTTDFCLMAWGRVFKKVYTEGFVHSPIDDILNKITGNIVISFWDGRKNLPRKVYNCQTKGYKWGVKGNHIFNKPLLHFGGFPGCNSG